MTKSLLNNFKGLEKLFILLARNSDIQATWQRNWYNEKTEKNGWPLIYIFGTSFLTCKNGIFFVSSNKISLVQQISAKDALWWNYHLDQKYFIVFYVVPRCIFHVLFFEQCVLCTNLMICINLQFLRTLKKLSLVAFKSASVAPSLEFFFNVLEIQVTFQLLFLADTFSPSFPPFSA